jgi:outer membrane protein TolC
MRAVSLIPLGLLCTLFHAPAAASEAALAGAPAPSQPAPPPLTLPALLDQVMAHSPELQARQADVRAAAERPAPVRSLEDPMLMIELWQVPLNTAHIPLMFTLRQPITWPGKLAARAAVLAHDRPRAEADVGRSRRDLRLAATRGYFDYRLAVRSQEVLRAARALTTSFIAAVDVRYRVGRADLTELLVAQETQAALDNVLLDSERERDLAAAALNVLLSQPVDVIDKGPTEIMLSQFGQGPA